MQPFQINPLPEMPDRLPARRLHDGGILSLDGVVVAAYQVLSSSYLPKPLRLELREIAAYQPTRTFYAMHLPGWIVRMGDLHITQLEPAVKNRPTNHIGG